MIKNIQERMNKGELKKHINWYCWNGTKFQCDFNRLPLKGNDIRNTGLVFQSDNFVSCITNYIKIKINNNEDLVLPNDKIYIIYAMCDNTDIKEKLNSMIKINNNNNDNNDNNNTIIDKEYLTKIFYNYNKIEVLFKLDT
jgi:hypothetical protein